MKSTATARALAKINDEIAVLEVVKARLLAVSETAPESEPKPRKARKARGLPGSMPAGEARPIA